MKTVKKVKTVQQIQHKVKYPPSNDHIDQELGFYVDEESDLIEYRSAYEFDSDHRFFN